MKDLNKIPDKNPFKVPENYFEEVNRKIISATTGYNENKKAGLYSRFRPYILIAASVTGFIIFSYTAVKLLTMEKISSSLPEAVPERYSEYDFNDIDLTSLEESTIMPDFSEEVSDLKKTEIIDYLLSENIEIDDIYEQL